ncbi:hypothetical protein I3843_04G129000 [Carya illinoinensis]|nr:hypothetical protein I3843_04G129000 [Carya illinoinensis]
MREREREREKSVKPKQRMEGERRFRRGLTGREWVRRDWAGRHFLWLFPSSWLPWLAVSGFFLVVGAVMLGWYVYLFPYVFVFKTKGHVGFIDQGEGDAVSLEEKLDKV